MTTTSGVPSPTARSMRRIGLWGAPGSGKTTYLAALNVAVARASQDLMLYGSDDEATDFLAENTSMLTRHRTFPPATETLRPLSWALQLPIQREVRKRFGRNTTEDVTLQFNIDLLDAPGRTFASVPTGGPGGGEERLLFDEEESDAPAAPQEELIEHLAGCDGIVFLFDPIREWAEGDSYEYFQGTLLRIAQRRMNQGNTVISKLPQYLAVCVTKLDAPEVYRKAKLRGYRTFNENDPYLFPRVRDEVAEQFFAELCKGKDVGNSDLVSGAIRQFFMPDRVRYFITSAIGFYLGSAARFREQDYQNTVQETDGRSRIRGQIHPINIIEPLLWLGQCLSSTDG